MSRFANFQQIVNAPLQAKTPVKDDESPETPAIAPDDDEKDDDMTDIEEAKKAAFDAGVKAANERMNTVFASEHYAGREATAHTLLNKGMSAEDITDVLATLPANKPEAADPTADALKKAEEEGARKAMLAMNAAEPNAPLVDGAETGEPQTEAEQTDAKVSAILNDHSAFTGHDYKKGA